MCIIWTGFKFWMRLCTDEEWVIFHFHTFHKTTIWRCTGDNKTSISQLLTVFIVELITVTMTFIDKVFPIHFTSFCTRFYFTWVNTKAHCAAFFIYINLVTHQIDHFIFSVFIEFARSGTFHTAYITSKFHYCSLHAKA